MRIGFRSILLPPGAADLEKETVAEPEFFADLNLDKIVAAITLGKDDYDLKPFFYRPTRDLKTVEYRHEVMRDLEREDNPSDDQVVCPQHAGDPRASRPIRQASLRPPEKALVSRRGRNLLCRGRRTRTGFARSSPAIPRSSGLAPLSDRAHELRALYRPGRRDRPAQSRFVDHQILHAHKGQRDYRSQIRSHRRL